VTINQIKETTVSSVENLNRDFNNCLVVIIDYGLGNINSIGRVLNRIGCHWNHSADPEIVKAASHIILPGVGHGGQAMCNLQSSPLLALLNDLVLIKRVPVLGICLGMQLMTRYTEEGSSECLAWLDKVTVELSPKRPNLKVPNIGWHVLVERKGSPLLAGVDFNNDAFYFCHRYGIEVSSEDDIIAEFNYGASFAGVLQKDNIFGVQFHPEKSKGAGVKVIKNFLGLESSV
jgi:glutamine amidotransferase